MGKRGCFGSALICLKYLYVAINIHNMAWWSTNLYASWKIDRAISRTTLFSTLFWNFILVGIWMTMVKGDYPLPNHDDKAFNKVITVTWHPGCLHQYSGPTRWCCIIKFANVWLGHGFVISWEQVNMFVGNEDELGIFDTDDQTSDKQSTIGQSE